MPRHLRCVSISSGYLVDSDKLQNIIDLGVARDRLASDRFDAVIADVLKAMTYLSHHYADAPVSDLVKQVASFSQSTKAQLDEFAKRDPRLKFDAPAGTAGVGVGVSGVANVSVFQRYNPKRPPPRPAIATARTNHGLTHRHEFFEIEDRQGIQLAAVQSALEMLRERMT